MSLCIGSGSIEQPIPTASEEISAWQPEDWIEKRQSGARVSFLAHKEKPQLLVVKKLIVSTANLFEFDTLPLLPDCNRIVKPFLSFPPGLNFTYATILFDYYPSGDLLKWRKTIVDKTSSTPVPESCIWRCFLHISQALAFLQNCLGPKQSKKYCVMHLDIKPSNILVVANGTSYPSFKLHDFGCARIFQGHEANETFYGGTFGWQPPENPRICNPVAEIWSLGACIHYLATGKTAVDDSLHHRTACLQAYLKDSCASVFYKTPENYCRARLPRRIEPINAGDYKYSDQLNEWMMICTSENPQQRPNTGKLTEDIRLAMMNTLESLGECLAFEDMEIQFREDE